MVTVVLCHLWYTKDGTNKVMLLKSKELIKKSVILKRNKHMNKYTQITAYVFLNVFVYLKYLSASRYEIKFARKDIENITANVLIHQRSVNVSKISQLVANTITTTSTLQPAHFADVEVQNTCCFYNRTMSTIYGCLFCINN